MRRQRTAIDRALDPDKQGPLINAVDKLLLDLGAPGPDGKPREKPNKFPITILGSTIFYRYPENSGDLNAFDRQMISFVLRMKDKLEIAGFPEPYRNALGIRDLDDDDLCTAFILHYWSHPDLKITEPQALTMVAVNPSVARQIMRRVDSEIDNGAMVISFGGVLEAKKKSPTTKPNASA